MTAISWTERRMVAVAVMALLVVNIPLVTGLLNIYLTNTEVRRILGLTSELHYVREGVINEYAMGWTVPVAATVQRLHFTWRDSGDRPLLYNMHVWVSDHGIPSALDTSPATDTPVTQTDDRVRKDPDPSHSQGGVPDKARDPTTEAALSTPYVNVSLWGTVPTQPETFALHLPCTGAVSAEVEVTLNINVTAPRPTSLPAVLYFRRRKICLKGQPSKPVFPHMDPLEKPEDTSNAPTPSLVGNTTPYIGVAVAGGAAVVLASVALTACYRRAAKSKQDSGGTELSYGNKTRSYTASTLLSPSTINMYSPSNPSFSSPFLQDPLSAHTYILPSTAPTNCYASLTRPLPRTTKSLNPHTTHPHTSYASSTHTHNTPHPHDPHPPQTPRSYTPHSLTLQHTSTRPSDVGRASAAVREVVVDPSMAEVQQLLKHLQVSPQRVRITSLLLEGRYGTLCKGVLEGVGERYPPTAVLIKSLLPSASRSSTLCLARSAAQLCTVRHSAVLAVAAVVLTHSADVMMLYADHGYRNLKLYLRGRSSHLTPEDLHQMALQVARGLAHLHRCGIRHGDLAARTCVVTEKYDVRVCDGGLGEDLFPDDYQAWHRTAANTSGGNDSKGSSDSSGSICSGGGSCGSGGAATSLQPIAWMALEELSGDSSSLPSDVWSWGVLAWELSSLAQPPYPSLPPSQLVEYLRDGYRLAQPPTCPDVLYQLMAFCWASNPQHRPRAALLVDYLAGLDQTNQRTSSNSNLSAESCSASERLELQSDVGNSILTSCFDRNSVCGAHNNTQGTTWPAGQHCDGLSDNAEGNSPKPFESLRLSPSRSSLSAVQESSRNATSSSSGPYDRPFVHNDDDVPPGLSHFPSTIYSTPTTLAGDLPWKLPPKYCSATSSSSKLPSKSALPTEGTLVVSLQSTQTAKQSQAAARRPCIHKTGGDSEPVFEPPPLPPTNANALAARPPRPQQPLPATR